ncbi:MAG: glycosyltransferase family 39 protein [Proteobacteria bacterium]|nr:glycosyltransferase family 39 protein [Pseudomonadota bacterium]
MSESNSGRSLAKSILRNVRDHCQQDYAVAIALAAIYAVVVLAIGLLIWPSQKLELRGVEPAVVWHVREFLLGKSLYPALDAPPFSVNQYTPVYYWILGGILRITDSNPTDPLHILRAGRLLSLSFSVVTSGVLFQIARSIFFTSRAAAVGGAIVATAWLLPWDIVARSDSLYLLCCAVTVWFFLRYMNEAPRLRFALSALTMLILVFFVRQSVVVLLAAFALTVLVLRPWQEVLRLVTINAAAIAVVTIGLALFDTGHFLNHIVAGVNNGFDVRQAMMSSWLPLVRGYQVPLIFAAIAVLTWSTANPPVKALTLVAAGCLVFGVLLSFKYGSDFNYYDEFFLFSALLYAVLLEKMRDWLSNDRAHFNALAFVLSLILVFGALAQNFGHLHDLRFADINQEKQLSIAVARFAGEGKSATPVITNDVQLALYVKGPVWLPQFKTWTSSVLTGAINPAVAARSAPRAIAVITSEACPGSAVVDRSNVGARITYFTREFFKEFVIIDQVLGHCILRYPTMTSAISVRKNHR